MLTELREMFAYNHWANERLLARCATLAAPDVTRELGGSFPSVWTTLAHLYGAENSWLARWQGTPTGRLPDLEEVTDIAGLHAKWNDVWARQSAFVAEVTEEDLRRSIGVVFRNGMSFEQQMGATMRHCMNHATYHRGQVTNYLRMLGTEAVPLDLVYYYMEHPPA
jgi:uncharacterized damage-inducible protein DinB